MMICYPLAGEGRPGDALFYYQGYPKVNRWGLLDSLNVERFVTTKDAVQFLKLFRAVPTRVMLNSGELAVTERLFNNLLPILRNVDDKPAVSQDGIRVYGLRLLAHCRSLACDLQQLQKEKIADENQNE